MPDTLEMPSSSLIPELLRERNTSLPCLSFHHFCLFVFFISCINFEKNYYFGFWLKQLNPHPCQFRSLRSSGEMS